MANIPQVAAARVAIQGLESGQAYLVATDMYGLTYSRLGGAH